MSEKNEINDLQGLALLNQIGLELGILSPLESADSDNLRELLITNLSTLDPSQIGKMKIKISKKLLKDKTINGEESDQAKSILDNLTLTPKSEVLDIPFYDANKKVVYYKNIITALESLYTFKTLEDTKEVLYYDNGIYKYGGEALIQKTIMSLDHRIAKKNIYGNVIFQIQAKTFLDREDFDTDKDRIHLKNGIYNLKTDELELFSPDVYATKTLPIKFKPEAKCPKFEKFIREIVDEKDGLGIQEMFGYCLLRDYPIHKIFIMTGEGRNGKSVLLDVLAKMLGDKNICSVSLQDLAKDRFGSVELYHKFANICADLPSTALNSTGMVKMLSGGDWIRGQRKFKDSFAFKNYAKLIFSANEIPKVNDYTSSFFRRLFIVYFPNTFEGKNDNKNLKHELFEEIEGIFNWSLEGLRRLMKQQEFSICYDLEEMHELYEKLTNPLYNFFEEKIGAVPEAFVPKAELYAVYIDYCKKNKLPILTDNNFGKKVKEFYGTTVSEFKPKIENARITCWKGIKPKISLPSNNEKEVKVS